jgi:hypothetical protein
LICALVPGSRLKVIGLGGVGCIVLRFLVIFLRHLDIPLRLVLIDGDDFEPSNMSRMEFQQLGAKADVKAAEIVDMLDFSEVGVFPVSEYVNRENIERLIRSGDHVFLCVDNHATRRLVAEHCAKLPNVALFSGGNDGVNPPTERGTYGNVQIHIRRDETDWTAPLTKFHPEIRRAEGELPGGPNCGQLAESIPQILFANLGVASAMLNAFFAYTCGRLGYQEVQFDILGSAFVASVSVAGRRHSATVACAKIGAYNSVFTQRGKGTQRAFIPAAWNGCAKIQSEKCTRVIVTPAVTWRDADSRREFPARG